LADYRDHYEEIRAAGTSVVAVSVDPPAKSEAVRRELRLPFPILSDTERRVVQDWDIYNPREMGGIAKPAVFVIGRDRVVRYSGVDEVATRVPAREIVRILDAGTGAQPVRRKIYIPRPSDFLRAIRSKTRPNLPGDL
jgi:peroxiredoxin